MSFGLSQVICPVHRELCSGAHFDCYTKCRRQADADARVRRQIRRDREAWISRKQNEFDAQMRMWDSRTTPCPQCGASVQPDKKREHVDWHWENDRGLSL